jgi:hypothetical protein
VDVAAQPVELGYGDRRRPALPAGRGERITEFRATIERIGALAALDLDKLVGDLEALGFGEATNRSALGVESESGSALLAGRNPEIGDERLRQMRPLPLRGRRRPDDGLGFLRGGS